MALMGLLKEVPKEQKRGFKQNANALRQSLTEAFEQKKQAVGGGAKPRAAAKPLLDVTDPAVFESVGYDPEEWTGFAFGLGIERLAMRQYDIKNIR